MGVDPHLPLGFSYLFFQVLNSNFFRLEFQNQFWNTASQISNTS